MILEGIVTTRNADGKLNVAPMGPVVDAAMSSLRFRLFKPSQTYDNLCRCRAGVFHVLDDVLLIARSAIGRLEPIPETFLAQSVDGAVLSEACRWYEFQIDSLNEADDCATMTARVVYAGRLRDFFGFNRAKHAVLEAAILATRIHWLREDDVLAQLAVLKNPVEKTAGPAEREAFDLLEKYITEYFSRNGPV